MSFCLLFYGLLLLFYDFLAQTNHAPLLGLNHFRRIQQQIGARQAHWILRLLAVLMLLVGISMA